MSRMVPHLALLDEPPDLSMFDEAFVTPWGIECRKGARCVVLERIAVRPSGARALYVVHVKDAGNGVNVAAFAALPFVRRIVPIPADGALPVDADEDTWVPRATPYPVKPVETVVQDDVTGIFTVILEGIPGAVGSGATRVLARQAAIANAKPYDPTPRITRRLG